MAATLSAEEEQVCRALLSKKNNLKTFYASSMDLDPCRALSQKMDFDDNNNNNSSNNNRVVFYL